jgi:hypothetical protein
VTREAFAEAFRELGWLDVDVTDDTTTLICATDGSCLDNGQVGAAAGIGVHVPDEAHGDVSATLPGGRQTNNRAEIYTLLVALQISVGPLCANSAPVQLLAGHSVIRGE